MHIIIPGQCPSQKNDKRMAYNKSTGKPFPITGKRTKEWQDMVYTHLKSNYRGCADGKVTITYQFYVKDDRRRDIDNMICSTNDALKKAGLIVDDSWQWLAIGAADAEIDRDNPRVELYIEED